MAERPVVPPKKNDTAMKIRTGLDYPEHRNLLDADSFYDCEEEVANQQNQNYTIQPPAPTNCLSEEQELLNHTFTQSAGAEENSEEPKMGKESKAVEQISDEEELSEVLKKLLQYGEEIRACARQCGIDTESFDCVVPECTGTEPSLEPFVASETPEPTVDGDTQPDTEGDIEGEVEERETSSSLILPFCAAPGEDVWCSACSSPRSFNRPATPTNSVIDTIRNLRWNSLEEYFREHSNSLVWPKRSEVKEEEKAQTPQPSDKQVYHCMKKSKSDSEVLCLSFQEQKSEDDVESKSESSTSTSEPEREHSSTDWSTLSCHTVSSVSDSSDDDDDRSSSLDGTQDDDDDVLQDDSEGRPDAAGDCGGSCISIQVTGDELNDGFYDINVEDHVCVTAETGDVDRFETYNFHFVPEAAVDNEEPPRLSLATEQMLSELFPDTRLQPRQVRILQTLPDQPPPESTNGGGEGDFELGRRFVVQSFFVEHATPVQEVIESNTWGNPGIGGYNRDSFRELLRWTTLAGFCASAFLIWQFHHNFR